MDREAWCVPVFSEDSQYGAGQTGDNLMDDVIDNILRSGKIELPDPHASLVEKAICDYVEEIFRSFVTMNIMRS